VKNTKNKKMKHKKTLTSNSVIIKPNPFTTRSGEMPHPYLGRDKELEQFTEIIDKLDRNRKDHFIVIGEWGSGKTTFLQRCTELGGEKNIISAILRIPEFKKQDRQIEVIIAIVEELARKLPVPHNKLKNFNKAIQSISINALGTGFSISRDKIQPHSFQTLLHVTLQELAKDLKKYHGVMILLDDIQNLKEIPEVFTTFRNVLMEKDIVDDSNILWGMACTPKEWNRFLMEKHHPIGRYFTRINLKNFDKETTETIVRETIKDTGVEFTNKIIKQIHDHTQGHAYELQVICHSLYKNQLKGRVNGQQWEPSLNETLRILGERVFNGWYERASEKEAEIIKVMADYHEPVDLSKIIHDVKQSTGFSAEEITAYMPRIDSKELVVKFRRGVYYIPDRLFREYLTLLR